MPFEKGSRIASLNFISLAVRQEKKRCFSSVGKCFPLQKVKGFGLHFPTGNLHPQVCPLDFSPAPRVGCVDGDDVLDNAAPVNTDTTVTIVTHWEYQA